MTNQDGEKVFNQDYLPFGGDLPKAGQLEVQNETNESYKYTGQKEVASIGLYYYGARYYDPAIGRFTRQDSYRGKLKKPQSQHLYVYVLNNPLKYTDPTGHKNVKGAALDKESDSKSNMKKQNIDSKNNLEIEQPSKSDGFFNQSFQNESGTIKSTAFMKKAERKGLLKGNMDNWLNTKFAAKMKLNETKYQSKNKMFISQADLVSMNFKAGLTGMDSDGVTGFEAGGALVEAQTGFKVFSSRNYNFYLTANGYAGGYKVAAGYTPDKGYHITIPAADFPAGGGLGFKPVLKDKPSPGMLEKMETTDFGIVGDIPQNPSSN